MAKERYRIHVTQDDIDSAVRNNSHHCAVSTAIQREIPNAIHISTDIQTIRLSLEDERVRLTYLTPAGIQDYIVAFDAGDPLKPFAFTLYRPAWETPMGVRVSRASSSESIVMADGSTVVTRRTSPHPKVVKSGRRFGRRQMRVNQPETPSGE